MNPGRDALHDAVLAACRIRPEDVNPLNSAGYQFAIRCLQRSGATPQEVAARAERMRQAYTVPVTPKLLAAHWAEFAPRSSATVVASGLFWHPDRCPSPCIGCAADRKVGT